MNILKELTNHKQNLEADGYRVAYICLHGKIDEGSIDYWIKDQIIELSRSIIKNKIVAEVRQ